MSTDLKHEGFNQCRLTSNRRKNMKNNKTLIAIAILLSLFVSDAFATNINKRQANQQSRIAQGVASGELPAWETAKLQKGQMQLARMEKKQSEMAW